MEARERGGALKAPPLSVGLEVGHQEVGHFAILPGIGEAPGLGFGVEEGFDLVEEFGRGGDVVTVVAALDALGYAVEVFAEVRQK